MPLTNKYSPGSAEPRLQGWWGESGAYHFSTASDAEIYSIDTPPPTVSGRLHLGHVYSYSQTDFMARFWRMNGCNVFYPMGYDDNGLPTERLVERELGIRATEIGREAFVEKCLQVSEEAEKAYRQLWERLGLSIDWRYSYRTIDDRSQRIAQLSFVRLYRDGLIYRKEAPTIWCPECRTAIAQAELNDLARESVFYTLAFPLREGGAVEIATTRPELLPACVAIFVHPDDVRFRDLVGRQASVPLFGQEIPILTDPQAEPEKGTGAVMCCTFGDVTDVAWWHTHKLPLRDTIDRAGRMTDRAGAFAGLSLVEARRRIVNALDDCGALLGRRPISQSVRVHERCDTPVEYIVTPQWFARVLDFERGAGGSRRTGALASGAHGRAVSGVGGEPGLGLVSFAAKVLRRTDPGLVLRRMRRNPCRRRGCAPARPGDSRTGPRVPLRQHGLQARAGRTGHLGHFLIEPADRGPMAGRSRAVRPGVPVFAAPASA